LILPPSDEVTIDEYVGHGLQANEIELPDDNALGTPFLYYHYEYSYSAIVPCIATGAATQPTFDAGAMTQLQEMGFPEVRCQRALLATGNRDAEAAMEWLFAHMDDPGPSHFVLMRPS
jgi:ubiquitin carboxyl-terminal hydrolase 5/13